MKHLIILLSGREDEGKRASLAFNIALSAVACNEKARLFLVFDGVCWANPTISAEVKVGSFPSIADSLREFLELGGEVHLCSSCIGETCSPLSIPRDQIQPGIQISSTMAIIEYSRDAAVYTF